MEVAFVNCDEGQTCLINTILVLALSDGFTQFFFICFAFLLFANTIWRAIGSAHPGILMIYIKEYKSFENKFRTHSGELLITREFPINGSFWSSSFCFPLYALSNCQLKQREPLVKFAVAEDLSKCSFSVWKACENYLFTTFRKISWNQLLWV